MAFMRLLAWLLKASCIITILISASFLPMSVVDASTLPAKPASYYYDRDQILSQKTKSLITGTNKAWADSRNVPEIYVATMTENGADVDDLASNVFKSWGIGQSSSDNGILILVNQSGNTRNIRIEVGYGLESTLTDANAGKILDRYRTELKSQNVYEVDRGIQHVFESVKNIINPTANSTSFKAAPRTRTALQWIEQHVLLLLLIVIIVLPWVTRFIYRQKHNQIKAVFDPEYSSNSKKLRSMNSLMWRVTRHHDTDAIRIKLAIVVLAAMLVLGYLFQSNPKSQTVMIVLFFIAMLVFPGNGSGGSGGSNGDSYGGSNDSSSGGDSGSATGGGSSGGGGASI